MSKMITLRLSDDRVAEIDRLVAEGQAPNRSAAMVAALDWWLSESARRAIDAAIVEGYRRIPPTAEEDRAALEGAELSVADEPW